MSIQVFKIGGNVVDNPELLEKFCKDFAGIEGRKCLVHGGGVIANKIQEALGQKPIKIEGRRVTDEETLKVVTMVYSGWCNKNIVSLLQKEGCNAIGLSGCDGNVIKAAKRAPKKISDGSLVDYGYVGDVKPESVNVKLIENLLDQGLVPVFCAINHDGKGQLLNTNADTIACSMASALKAELIYCFEKKGVLLDKDDDSTVIPEINPEKFEELKAGGCVADGMLPKLENSFKALKEGATLVTIKHSSDVLFTNCGTKLSL